MPCLTSIKKTWLITGAAGFIGSHLVEALLRHNQRVIGLDNFLTGKRENIQDSLTSPDFTFIEGDIRDYATCLSASQNVDYVLHQAALVSVPLSLEDPLTTHEINVTGFLNILLAAKTQEVARVIYASSSAVYGDAVAPSQVESAPAICLSPYATSKRMDELYGEIFYRCYGLSTVGLRYFNVYGPRQDPKGAYAAVIPLWIDSLRTHTPCYINGDGSHSRDFCYVEDVVQANIAAALSPNPQIHGEVYNVASGASTTLLELYALLQKVLELPKLPPLHRPNRPGDIQHSLANIEKAMQMLGYQPSYSLEEGLRRMV